MNQLANDSRSYCVVPISEGNSSHGPVVLVKLQAHPCLNLYYHLCELAL